MLPGEVKEYWVELQARDGRAVLVGPDGDVEREFDPTELALPTELTSALHEWAEVVEAVLMGGRVEERANAGDLMSRRGRQLAGRLAAVLMTEVDYVDPVSGRVETVPASPAPYGRPLPPGPLAPALTRRVLRRQEVDEPTPWATGLTITGFAATLVTFTLMVLSTGLAQTSPWLALVANVLLVAGLLPSVWLARRALVWRWVALGVVVGIGVAWFLLLLTLLVH